MQAFFVIKDALGGEVRFPINGAVVGKLPHNESPHQTPTKSTCGASGRVQRYTDEFRDCVVSAYVTGAMSLADCAVQYKVPIQTLDHWVRARMGSSRRDRWCR